jgi:hypothetical protein
MHAFTTFGKLDRQNSIAESDGQSYAHIAAYLPCQYSMRTKLFAYHNFPRDLNCDLSMWRANNGAFLSPGLRTLFLGILDNVGGVFAYAKAFNAIHLNIR